MALRDGKPWLVCHIFFSLSYTCPCLRLTKLSRWEQDENEAMSPFMQRQISFMALVNLQSGASVQMLLFIKKLRKWKRGCNSAAHRKMEPLPQVLMMFAVKTLETILSHQQPKRLWLSLNMELLVIMSPQDYFKWKFYPLPVQFIRIQFCIDKIDLSGKVNSFSEDEEGHNPFKMKFMIIDLFHSSWDKSGPIKWVCWFNCSKKTFLGDEHKQAIYAAPAGQQGFNQTSQTLVCYFCILLILPPIFQCR